MAELATTILQKYVAPSAGALGATSAAAAAHIQDERMNLYRKAQEIIYLDAPVSPVYYNAISHFVKPWVKKIEVIPPLYFQDVVLGKDEGS